MTDVNVFDTIGTMSEPALDSVVGVATSPVDTAVSVKDEARRRGAEVTQRAADRIEETVDEAMALPERIVVAYLRVLRGQSQRGDVVGAASRRVLSVVHGPAHAAAGFFTRIEHESATGARRRGRGRPRAAASGPDGRSRGKRGTTSGPRTTSRKRAPGPGVS